MPKLRVLLVFLALPAALALLLGACGDDSEDDGDNNGSPSASAGPTVGPPDKVTFMAGFKPQANLPFVGAYVAQEKGFFEEQNLDVTIEHVTTPGDNFRFLAAGNVQFTTSDASGLLEKHVSDPPLDIVSLALIGQRGQQGFSVLADSGIESPADWAGKTAGYKGSQVTPDYLAILAANGVDRGSIQEVKVGFDPRILIEGQVDIFPVFVSNEPDTLETLGYTVKTWEAADFEAPTLGLTYVAMSDYVTEHAAVTQRFINAVLKAIDYADQNREEALDIVMKYAPDEDRDHQRYMLETELDMAGPGPAGVQTKAQWQDLHDFLVQYGAISKPVDDVAVLFTDRFVKAYYEAPTASSSAAP
ncbi:MAG TPA: ABC transporter substrate-binding protein [Dehalococcoidia bacterium]|nr:ABC transporter substrate-binding protein [Dehalococcoidia bacterium]